MVPPLCFVPCVLCCNTGNNIKRILFSQMISSMAISTDRHFQPCQHASLNHRVRYYSTICILCYAYSSWLNRFDHNINFQRQTSATLPHKPRGILSLLLVNCCRWCNESNYHYIIIFCSCLFSSSKSAPQQQHSGIW